jgi:hypothetical protein
MKTQTRALPTSPNKTLVSTLRDDSKNISDSSKAAFHKFADLALEPQAMDTCEFDLRRSNVDHSA